MEKLLNTFFFNLFMTNYQTEISGLEQEISLHQRFLQREHLFTLVGVDEEHRVRISSDKPSGLITRKSYQDPSSVLFLDDTVRDVINYLESLEVPVEKREIPESQKYVIYTCGEGGGYSHIGGDPRCATIWRPPRYTSKLFKPEVLFFPQRTPIHFYMALSEKYLEDLTRFKEGIMSTANDKKLYAERRLKDLLEEPKRIEEEKRKHEEKLRDICIRSGIKI